MRAVLLLALASLAAASLAGCTVARYQSLSRQDARAIISGMALAQHQSEDLARSAPPHNGGM